MDPNDPNREKQSGWEQEEQIARQAADELRGKAQKAAEKKITQSSAYKTASTAANKGLTAAKAGVKQVGSKVAAKLGLKGAAALAGTAFGGPLGTAVMYALAEVAEKLLGAINRGLKKLLGEDYKKQLAALGLGMAATGAAVASSPLLIGGAAMTGGALLVGGTKAIRGGTGILGRAFRNFGKTFVSGLLPALIFLFLGVPLIIALITFIINTGGWVYPPWEGISNTNNLPSSIYIDVTKVPSPRNRFENEDVAGGLTVTYTITVSASRSTLTDISFEYTCQVLRESGSGDCPSPSPDLPAPPDQIVPGTPFVFTYTQRYDTNHTDSSILDTFIVTATAEGNTGERAGASALVIIGNPPTACFIFNETVGVYTIPGGSRTTYSLGWSSYPDKYQKVIESIAYLSHSPSWVALVCNGGNVTLTHAAQVASYGGWAPSESGSDIILYTREGLGYSVSSVIYTFAHESGHIIYYRNDLMATYRTMTAGEGLLPTYPGTTSQFEDFAEIIGVYPVYDGYYRFDGILDQPQWAGHKAFGEFIYQIVF